VKTIKLTENADIQKAMAI